jgi:hypothetical protein
MDLRMTLLMRLACLAATSSSLNMKSKIPKPLKKCASS